MCVSIPGGGTLNSTTKFNHKNMCVLYIVFLIKKTLESHGNRRTHCGVVGSTHRTITFLYSVYLTVSVSLCVSGHMAKAEDSLQESWIKPRPSGLTAGTTKPYPQHLSFLAFYYLK